MRKIILLTLLLATTVTLFGQFSLSDQSDTTIKSNRIETSVRTLSGEWKAGEKVTIAVSYIIPEGLYQQKTPDYFYFKIKPKSWLKPGKIIYPPLPEEGKYKGTVELKAVLKLTRKTPQSIPPIELTAFYQVCEASGLCLAPSSNEMVLDINGADSAGESLSAAGSQEGEVTSDAKRGGLTFQTLLIYLLMAFAGGIILNVMPCVLPVLSIKAMSLIKQSNEEPKEIFLHTVLYTAGVLAAMALFAFALILVQQLTGNLVNWGSQMQNGAFLFGLILILFIFGLSLFDVYTILPPSFANSSGGGRTGAFVAGLFVVLVGTPCTAPFLAPAAGFFLAQPPLLILLFFIFVGLGLALPFWVMVLPVKKPIRLFLIGSGILGAFTIAVLSLYGAPAGTNAFLGFFDRYIRTILLIMAAIELILFIPVFKVLKPGEWMNDFKKGMGILMLGTAAFFLGIYFKSRVESFFRVSAFLLLITSALIVYGKLQLRMGRPWLRRLISGLMILVLIGSGIILVSENISPMARYKLDKKIFVESEVEAALEKDERMLITFSADWCLTCKENDRTIFNKRETGEFLKKTDVQVYYGDYTRTDPVITKWIRRYNRGGVPVYIFNPGNGSEPRVLPDDLTKQLLFDLINESIEDQGVEDVNERGNRTAEDS